MEGMHCIDSLLSEAATLVLRSLVNSAAANAERIRRQSVVNWIDGLCAEFVGLRSLSVGAFLNSTSLLITPEELELTLFFDKNDASRNDQWFLSLYAALCKHSASSSSSGPNHQMVVDRISYFPKEQRLEAFTDNILVSIRPNDIGSLTFASLLEDFDRAAGGESLLKRSILLIKAWCIFEAPNLRPGNLLPNLHPFHFLIILI